MIYNKVDDTTYECEPPLCPLCHSRHIQYDKDQKPFQEPMNLVVIPLECISCGYSFSLQLKTYENTNEIADKEYDDLGLETLCSKATYRGMIRRLFS